MTRPSARDRVRDMPSNIAARLFVRACGWPGFLSAAGATIVVAITQVATTVVAGFVVSEVPQTIETGSVTSGLTSGAIGLACLALVQFLVGVWRAGAVANVAGRVYLRTQEDVQDIVLAPNDLSVAENSGLMDDVAFAQGIYGNVAPFHTVEPFFRAAAARISGLMALAVVAWYSPVLAVLLLAANAVWARYARRLVETIWAPIAHKSTDLRRSEYIRDLATNLEVAKEVRIFALAPWLTSQVSAFWFESMRPLWTSRHRLSRELFAPGLLLVACEAFAYGRIALSGVSGSISLFFVVVLLQQVARIESVGFAGDDAFLLQSGSIAMRKLEQLVATRVAPARSAAVAPIAAAASRNGRGPHEGDIVLRGVSFAYPNGVSVFDGLDLTLAAGRSTAIVGDNGAGKSTLVNLLCRLYEPSAGSITVGDRELASMSIDDWRSSVSVVFQDFVRYPFSVRDSVVLADDFDPSRFERCLALAGAKDLVESLPGGMDTLLTRQYTSGVDLSGGEWQRLGLARAIYRARPGGLLILDEPSANLDIRAEADLFESFLDVTAGQTALLISHRLWTCRHADRVVLIGGGRVIETGTHDELVARRGPYWSLYSLQAQQFADTIESA